MSVLSQRPADPVVGESHPHESASLHVTGTALYTDDLVNRYPGVLHAEPVQSPHAHAPIVSLDATAAQALDGVVGVLTAAAV
ncbi:MAG: xanthine dehydrogenase molybdopterin binding subunit, partial [Corynebacterium sp.]|nr:xanthine dehydrogenase molybdopterin binding subunit [Corynebacterium sp.]